MHFHNSTSSTTIVETSPPPPRACPDQAAVCRSLTSFSPTSTEVTVEAPECQDCLTPPCKTGPSSDMIRILCALLQPPTREPLAIRLMPCAFGCACSLCRR